MLESDAEVLWMLDADMQWAPEDFYALVDLLHPEHRPVVAGLYVSGSRTGDAMYPLVMVRTDNGLEFVLDLPENTPVACAATGAGFMLWHRSVLERMARPHPEGFGTFPDGTPNPYPWFADEIVDGKPRGEDVVACLRAGELGYPIIVHTGIEVVHKKPFYLSVAFYRETLAAQRAQEAPCT